MDQESTILLVGGIGAAIGVAVVALIWPAFRDWRTKQRKREAWLDKQASGT